MKYAALIVLLASCGSPPPAVEPSNEQTEPHQTGTPQESLVDRTVTVLADNLCGNSQFPQCFALEEDECRIGITGHTRACFARFAHENREPENDGEEALAAWFGELFDCAVGAYVEEREAAGHASTCEEPTEEATEHGP